MKNIAVIDIGSNSMRVVVCKTYPDNSFKIIDEEKQMARLGQYIDSYNNLSEEGLLKAIKTLDFFKIVCLNNNVEKIIVVATEAIRRANNSEYVVSEIKRKTGLDIRILSGEEEAYYGYMAIKYSMQITDALLVDIGGSSMEITLVKNNKINNSISLPLGAIPLTKVFPFDVPATYEDRCKLKYFLFKYFDDIPWLKKASNLPLIGIGGASRAIGKIHKKSINYPLDLMHNYNINFLNVNNVFENVASLNLKQKIKIKGLPKERVDIITAPIGAITSLMEYCNSSELRISQFGIREGVIYEIILGNNLNIDMLDWSITNIITNQNLNAYHSNNIWEISKLLYCGLENNPSALKLLKVASKLHDLGVNISIKQHYKHSFYMILNSSLAGLSHKELLMVSYIIALSSKNDFKLKQDFKDLISKDESDLCKKLALLLTLSHKLNRYYNINSLKEFTIENTNSTFTVTLPKENFRILSENISENIKTDFEKYFNKNISFQ